jgi:hypothetical protein
MTTADSLRKANPDLPIHDVTSPEFARYGRVVSGLGGEQASAYAREHALPGEGIVYEPAVAGLEADAAFREAVSLAVYGGMPVQVGWCYGRGSLLNGLEYHKGSEVIGAVTDIVLLLGRVEDITWEPEPRYDTVRIEAFFVPAGGMVELYAGCLHYAPIQVSQGLGFAALIVLPAQTNSALERQAPSAGESRLLFARNKWLIVHPEDAGDIRAGAFVGLKGKNIQVASLE